MADPCAASEFVTGIATAGPTSVWTPLANAQTSGPIALQVPGQFNGQSADGHPVQLAGIIFDQSAGIADTSPLGCALDSATVEYSPQAGQPALHLALAVFGNCTALLRAAYSVHAITRRGNVVMNPGGPANAG